MQNISNFKVFRLSLKLGRKHNVSVGLFYILFIIYVCDHTDVKQMKVSWEYRSIKQASA